MADSTETRALLLQINATTELLRSQLTDAEKATEHFRQSTEEHLGHIDEKYGLLGKSLEKLEGPLERLKSLGEVAIGALLGESLIEAGKKSLEFAGNVKFVSEQVGTSTDFLQKYRYAAGQFGVATAQADEGLTKFARSIGEAANGNKASIEIFDRLGVKVRDSSGAVRSVEAVYLDTANAIQKVDSPAQKTADTMALLGRGAAGLAPLLASGAEGFNNLAAAAEQLGVVLSPELIEHSEEVNHKLAALKQIVDAQMASAIAQNALVIEGLASSFVTLAGAIAKFNAQHPDEAAAILGALAGAKVGGVYGAAAGALAGPLIVNKVRQDAADAATDTPTRLEEERKAGEHLKSLLRLREASGGDLGSTDDLAEAQREFARQRQLLRASVSHPPAEGGLGSTGAGATNDNGEGLASLNKQIADLEREKVGTSGAVLAAYNTELAEKRREVGFIKQGASAEMAKSLAGKEGAAISKGESDARKASRQAEEQRQKNLQADVAYQAEELRLRKSILDGAKSSAGNDAARDDLQKQIINAEADTLKATVADKLAKGGYGTDAKVAEARAKTILSLNEQNRLQGIANVDLSRAVQNQKDATDKAALQLQGETDLAGLDDRLALTRTERLKVELQLLALQEKAAIAAQQAIIDSKDPKVTQAQRDAAQTRIDQIGAQHAGNVTLVQRANVGPLEDFKKQLQTTVGDTNDALQSLEVSAIGQMGDAFESAAAKALHLHGVLGNIIGDFLKLIEQKAELALVGGGGGGLGGLLGGLFGGAASDASIFKASPALQGILGFADGGSPPVGVPSLVGERGPELFIPTVPGRVIANDNLRSVSGPPSELHLHMTVEGVSNKAEMAAIAAQAAGVAYQQAVASGGAMLRDVQTPKLPRSLG